MRALPALFALLALLAAGCATTTNAFVHLRPDYSDLPAEPLREVAAGIEAIVAEERQEFALDFGGDIVIDLPEIRQAVRTRAIRSELVSDLLDSGFAIEKNNGLLAIQRSSAYKKATNSRERDRDALIVMGENQNRWTIYEGLLKANNWPPRSLSAIQETFFLARVSLLTPGQQHEAAAP